MSHTAPSDPVAALITALEAQPSRARVSDADMEVMYAFAYQLAAQAHFETAYRYFSILTLYRPTCLKYLAGTALCHRMLQRYDAALGVYAFMAVLEPQQPQHHLSMAECLLLQGQAQQARDALSLVARFCAKTPGHEPTAQRAQAIVTLLSGQTADAA